MLKKKKGLKTGVFPFPPGRSTSTGLTELPDRRHQIDKKVKDISGYNSRGHVLFVKRPSLSLHGHHPRPLCQLLYKQTQSAPPRISCWRCRRTSSLSSLSSLTAASEAQFCRRRVFLNIFRLASLYICMFFFARENGLLWGWRASLKFLLKEWRK